MWNYYFYAYDLYFYYYNLLINMKQYKKSNTTVSGAWAEDKWVSCVIVGLFLAFTIVKLKGPNKSLAMKIWLVGLVGGSPG